MLYLYESKTFVKNPDEIDKLSPSIKEDLYKKLDQGLVLFVMPDEYSNTGYSSEKKHKKNYKVGFLYDALLRIYPRMNKMEAHSIISEKYHLWITYRQFFTHVNEYEKAKPKYLIKPKMLFK